MSGMAFPGEAEMAMADYDLVLELAGPALGQDREGYRKEFLGLVMTAEQLD